MLSARQLLISMTARFAEKGMLTPALDARLLLTRTAGLDELDLITNADTPLSVDLVEKIEERVSRRLKGEPVSRILGEREFYGLSYEVTPETLDPRPDTETLIDAVLKTFQPGYQARPLTILDLGTGTGCILITLLVQYPNARGVTVDISPQALATAKRNAVRHGVRDRIEFLHGSWLQPLSHDATFDVIVSNPPYIPDGDIPLLEREVRNYDPFAALSGGPDGLAAYKTILDDVKKHLCCDGYALFEIGQGQEKDLARLAEDSKMSVCDSHTDLGGIVRVVTIRHGEK